MALEIVSRAEVAQDGQSHGPIPAPDSDVAAAEDAEGWRPFKEGDIAVYYSKLGNLECDGQTMSITRDYHYELVKRKAARYVDCDGERVDYQWGYCAKFLTGDSAGEEYFFPAYQLRSPRSEITHVRLVSEFAHQRGAK